MLVFIWAEEMDLQSVGDLDAFEFFYERALVAFGFFCYVQHFQRQVVLKVYVEDAVSFGKFFRFQEVKSDGVVPDRFCF